MACGLWLKQPGVYLLAFLASRRLKALGFGSGLLHVLAVLGLAKMLRALAVVNLAISIYPNLTRCSSSGGGSGCINRFFRWRSSSNSSRRSLRSSRSRRFCSSRSASSASGHNSRSSKQAQSSEQNFGFHGKYPEKYNNILM